MSWWKHLRKFLHREVRQIEHHPGQFLLAPLTSAIGFIPGRGWSTFVHDAEHFAKRSLYYTAKEAPYVTAAASAVASYLTPFGVGGYVVGGIGGEAERWGEYYAARENPEHGHKLSAWEARKRARKFANRTWEYSAVAAGVGALAGVIAPASGFSVSVGVAGGPSASTAGLDSGTLEAQGLGPTSGGVSLPASIPNVPAGQALIQNSAGEFVATGPVSQSPGFFSNAWNFVSGLPQMAWDNPTAALGLAGTGAGVAAQLGLFGKTGQAVATDIQFAQGVAGELGGGGGGSPGGPPIGGDAGGAADFGGAPSLLSQLEPLLIGLGGFILLLVLFAGM